MRNTNENEDDFWYHQMKELHGKIKRRLLVE